MLNLFKSKDYQVLSKLANKPYADTVNGVDILCFKGNQWNIQDILQVLYDIESSVFDHQLIDTSMYSLFEHLHSQLPIEIGYDGETDKPKSLNVLKVGPAGSPSDIFINWLKKELNFTYINE